MKVVEQLPVDACRRRIVYSSTALRGLAILAVVAEHAALAAMPGSVHDALVGGAAASSVRPDYSDPGYGFAVILLYTACRFAVPLFFVLSCFGLALRPIGRSGVRGFYRRKLPKLIVPYLVYFALYGGLNMLFARDLFPQHFATWPAFFKMALGFGGGHLWFIHTLILLHVLHPFAWRVYREVLHASPASVAVLGVIQIAMIAGICSLGDFSAVPLWLHPIGYPIFKSWWYLFAGYFLFDHADRVLAYTDSAGGFLTQGLISLAVLTGIAAFWTSYLLTGTHVGGVAGVNAVLYLPPPILAAAGVPAILAFAARIHGRLVSILTSFGLYSLGVYLLHPAVQLAIDRFLRIAFGLTSQKPLHLILSLATVPWVTLAVVRVPGRWSPGRLLT